MSIPRRPRRRTFCPDRTHRTYVSLMQRLSVTRSTTSSVPEPSRVSETSWPCHQTHDLLRMAARLKNGGFLVHPTQCRVDEMRRQRSVPHSANGAHLSQRGNSVLPSKSGETRSSTKLPQLNRTAMLLAETRRLIQADRHRQRSKYTIGCDLPTHSR